MHIICVLDPTKILLAASTWSQVHLQSTTSLLLAAFYGRNNSWGVRVEV